MICTRSSMFEPQVVRVSAGAAPKLLDRYCLMLSRKVKAHTRHCLPCRIGPRMSVMPSPRSWTVAWRDHCVSFPFLPRTATNANGVNGASGFSSAEATCQWNTQCLKQVLELLRLLDSFRGLLLGNGVQQKKHYSTSSESMPSFLKHYLATFVAAS